MSIKYGSSQFTMFDSCAQDIGYCTTKSCVDNMQHFNFRENNEVPICISKDKRNYAKNSVETDENRG